MLKKHLSLSLILAVLCLVCCACTSTEAAKGNVPAATDELKTDAYTVSLPQGFTARSTGGNGTSILLNDTEVGISAVFYLNGMEVGGIAVIPYENADQLTLDAFSQGGTAEAEALHDTLKDFVTLLAPGDQSPDYMFSDGSYGSFTLSVVNEDGTNSIMHEFFPAGDQFYDVFFEEASDVTPEQKEAVWSSFTLNP